MRVYLPATVPIARRLLASRALDAPLTAFAVTPGLREWYVDDDIDELEYAAMIEAARASLRLLDGDAAAARRRVVIALDAAEADVAVRDDLDRGVVRINAPVELARVASVHLDEAAAEAAVAAAAVAMLAAELGDASAQDAVDDAEGFELCWYATQELDDILAQIDPPAG